MRKYLLFDLDGTLTDSAEGIINSVRYALDKFGISENDEKKLCTFVGPPLYDSFRELYGMSHDDANLAIVYYREYFVSKGLYENTVYGGIREMLERLLNKDKKLILATSKPEKFAREILKNFSLDGYFYEIFGATMDEKLCRKDDIIEYALTRTGVSPDDAVMIGDRRYDIEGGRKNGLTTVGVLYGYGNRDELTAAKSDYIASTVNELEKILENI